MENNLKYITSSLELHLFFLRIMKEHALFLEAGFTQVNDDFIKVAETFKNEFQILLSQVVDMSKGVICEKVINSKEIVTEFTLDAEKQTEYLTGIDIDMCITQKQYQLPYAQQVLNPEHLYNHVSQINQAVLALLNQFIQFKEDIIKNVSTCSMFTMNYPMLLEHILREAKLYCFYLSQYENGHLDNLQTMIQTEQFWNQIMMEHSLFIRGLLDPSEAELIKVSNDFVKEYQDLLNCAMNQNDLMMKDQLCDPYLETIKLRDFKATGTKGILNCEVQSIIMPLLADHVLREANHYLRLLESKKTT